MKDKVSVTELQTAERHSHPALDIGGEKDERSIFDNLLQICIEEFKDKV